MIAKLILSHCVFHQEPAVTDNVYVSQRCPGLVIFKTRTLPIFTVRTDIKIVWIGGEQLAMKS